MLKLKSCVSDVWQHCFLFGSFHIKPVDRIMLIAVVVRFIWNLSENGS